MDARHVLSLEKPFFDEVRKLRTTPEWTLLVLASLVMTRGAHGASVALEKAPGLPPPAGAASGPVDRPEIAAIVAASDARFRGPESADARRRDYEDLKRALVDYPASYDILWRAARSVWAIGDRLDEDRDAKLLETMGVEAMGWADRAVAANPEGIEGRFYHGLAISVYSRGISILRALVKGLGKKYEEDMRFVIDKDPGWEDGAGQRALGRYYYRLPWPKRDLKKSETLLRESLAHSPGAFRTHLYLADTLALAGRSEEAAREYRFVLEHEPAARDLNELETVRGEARKGLAAVEKK